MFDIADQIANEIINEILSGRSSNLDRSLKPDYHHSNSSSSFIDFCYNISKN